MLYVDAQQTIYKQASQRFNDDVKTGFTAVHTHCTEYMQQNRSMLLRIMSINLSVCLGKKQR